MTNYNLPPEPGAVSNPDLGYSGVDAPLGPPENDQEIGDTEDDSDDDSDEGVK